MKKKNISFVNENICTGCYACYSKCHNKAIMMVKNDEGFYYPSIKPDNCVQCGLCVSVCPALKKWEKNKNTSLIRANAKDLSIRARGSSGGIVELLSNLVIESKGAVFGAVYSQKNKEIVHSSTEYVPLHRLLKSKYVQSQINDSFKEIKTLLMSGKKVLFSGTPCQVAGLKSFLGRDFENLVTVDFMCHGVPSPGLFSNMIKELEKKNSSEIIDVTFRSKANGWRRSTTTTTTYESGKVEQTPNKDSLYYTLFLNNYSLRKSCYRCSLYCRHVSDLTLADDWNIPSNLDDDTGMSLIFINTKKGQSSLDIIKNELNYTCLQVDSLDIEAYKHLYSWHGRKEFFSDYCSLSYESIQEKWLAKSVEKRQTINAVIHYYFIRAARCLRKKEQ